MARPTHVTIAKGFHKYTSAVKSPNGRTSVNNKEAIKMEEQDFALNFRMIHSLLTSEILTSFYVSIPHPLEE